MTQTFTLEGQKIVYNEEEKRIKTTIAIPFYSAGKILKWKNVGSAGIGLNHSIINFTLKTKSILIVHVSQQGKDYWIKHDVLKQFLKSNNTEYKSGGKKFVHVIAWSLFSTSMEAMVQ